MPQAVKVRSDIEVGCYAYEGVDAVKAALKAGIACETEDMPIKINLIAPPRYVVTTTTLDKEKGIKLLEEALQKIEQSIKNYYCHFSITTPVISSLTENSYFLTLGFIYSQKWLPIMMRHSWPNRLNKRRRRMKRSPVTMMMMVKMPVMILNKFSVHQHLNGVGQIGLESIYLLVE